MFRFVSRHSLIVTRAIVLVALVLSAAAFPALAAPPATQTHESAFAGKVRLTLPPVIYATPGVESNIYFDNIVLVINPLNYIFDVTCDLGFQYDERWTCKPDAKEAGDHPITIEVRDESNAVIARARSIVRVADPAASSGHEVSLLAIGDSHLQHDGTYLQDVLDLSKVDPSMHLTLVGCRGKGNKPPTDDLRHEGYNGWTAEAFATRNRPKPRTGEYIPAETGSPFIFMNDDNQPVLDFKKYCVQFNHGKPVDYVIIQLGGNDVWNCDDSDIDSKIDRVFGFYDMLIKMVRDYSSDTKIGVVMLDPLTRSQHGYRNYRADRKQTRWQYRRNQHRVNEREIETFGGREASNVYLLPVHLNIDCVHAFGTRALPLNARMPTTEPRVNDGAHLSPEGYLQMGDPIFAWLKACPFPDH